MTKWERIFKSYYRRAKYTAEPNAVLVAGKRVLRIAHRVYRNGGEIGEAIAGAGPSRGAAWKDACIRRGLTEEKQP